MTTTTVHAANLTSSDVGRPVRIEWEGWVHTGRLQTLQFEQSWREDKPPSVMVSVRSESGASWVKYIDPDTFVEVQRKLPEEECDELRGIAAAVERTAPVDPPTREDAGAAILDVLHERDAVQAELDALRGRIEALCDRRDRNGHIAVPIATLRAAVGLNDEGKTDDA